MQVAVTTFTVADYCRMMKARQVTVNREYQRTNKVWPPSARSYLIDTILCGYPIPKITLFQSTDRETRTTVKEIVDGQQRSRAILDFFDDKLRITTSKSDFAGKTYDQLEANVQHSFLDYPLSIDLIVGAEPSDIRQMFRRMNSYTVPLNPEEQRHAIHQGPFKWFIAGLAEDYSDGLKQIGVFTEGNLSRMLDARLFTEIAVAVERGTVTYSRKHLDSIYESYDEEPFPHEQQLEENIANAIDRILGWEELHRTALMKTSTFYSLLLAVLHCQWPIDALQSDYAVENVEIAARDIVLDALSLLADAAASEPEGDFEAFASATQEGTNTATNRAIRFRCFCKALRGEEAP
jgi:hypothetical protein